MSPSTRRIRLYINRFVASYSVASADWSPVATRSTSETRSWSRSLASAVSIASCTGSPECSTELTYELKRDFVFDLLFGLLIVAADYLRARQFLFRRPPSVRPPRHKLLLSRAHKPISDRQIKMSI